jgi:hypothetical protein
LLSKSDIVIFSFLGSWLLSFLGTSWSSGGSGFLGTGWSLGSWSLGGWSLGGLFGSWSSGWGSSNYMKNVIN